MTSKWVLYFDGACEPVNPGGNATYGWCLLRPDGTLFAEDAGFYCKGKRATNNVAEYAALLAGLQFMFEEGLCVPLLCRGDSQLVVNQINRIWRCKKKHLIPLCYNAIQLLHEVSDDWEIEWIPREQNGRADALSRSVLLI